MDYDAFIREGFRRYHSDPAFHDLVEEGIRVGVSRVVIPGQVNAVREIARWSAITVLLMSEKAVDGKRHNIFNQEGE